ncbi:MAG: DUF1206 domain-containing protein [Planctomycetaceae bacterium]
MTSAAEIRRRFFAPLRQGIEPGSWWVEYVARVGYLAQGIVYALVGVLAIQAAFTAARTPDTKDALAAIRDAPFGRLLLGLVAIGLFCYVAWRIVQAWWDTEHKGRTWKGVFIRTGYALSAVAYFGLAVAAGLAAIRGGSAGGSGSEDQQAAATVMAWPGGWVIVAVAGLIVFGVGVVHFWKAYTADFMHEYESTEMSAAERDWAKPVGRFGMAARGLTFCLIGLFLALAGWRTNAGQVKGLGDSFNVVASQPYGQTLLAVVAAGFVAYGVFCLSQAKYKRIAKV